MSKARKKTILRISRPSNCQEAREFPKFAGFCKLWIPGFAKLVHPVYEATRGENTPSTGPHRCKRPSVVTLINAHALALSNVTKPFHLYMNKKKRMAKGVLMQTLGPWKRPVAYLSKSWIQWVLFGLLAST